ncbi:MAG: hypothetical protein V1495_11530 [Pseudomonadota bacterium]
MTRKYLTLFGFTFVTVLSIVIACSSSTPFTFVGLGDVLPTLPGCGDPDHPCAVAPDTGNGPPSITNPEGTPIAQFTPIALPTATPAPTVEPTATAKPGDPTPTPLPTATPTPPIVRVNGSCINYGIGTTAVTNAPSGSFQPSLSGIQNYIVSVSSNGVDATFDMSLAPDLERIVIYHKGNSNTLRFTNAQMAVGICNELSGGSNAELFQNTSSAEIADLQSGTGGSNKLDIRLVPSWGLNYSLLGNGHCISAPAGTVVQNQSSNDNGHEVNIGNGVTCLP